MKSLTQYLLLSLLCLITFPPLGYSQSETDPKTLPTGWEQLEPTPLIDAIDNLLNSKSIINESHLEQSAAHLFGVISDSNFQSTAKSKVVIRIASKLSGSLGSYLSPAQKASVKTILQNKVSGDAQALNGSSFTDSKNNLWLPAIASGIARKNVADAALNWFDSNAWQSLAPRDMADLANLLEDDKVSANDYSVRFSGQLTPNQTGAFQFIPQARMVNAKLWIGGVLILDTKDTLDPNNPADTDISKISSSVALVNGVAVPFQLDLNCVYDPKNDPAPLELRELYQGWSNFMLHWKGFTGTQGLVPSSVFSPPSGSPPGSTGLRLEIHNGSALNDLQGTEYTPDPCWLLQGRGALSSNRAKQNQLLAQVISKAQSLSTLPVNDQESVFWAVKNISQHASLSQQQTLLNSLTQNPTCFQNIPASEMYHLQRSYKHLPGDPAVDAIIAWAKLSPTVDIKFGTYPSWNLRLDTFNHSNFGGYWHIARQTQDTDSITKLTAALEEADGSCNQRIARILSFIHKEARTLSQWITLLDQKLVNAQITGDKRVAWLIERAVAECCKHGDPPPLLIGRNFLDEALGSAQTESVKLRVVKEIAARLAAENRTTEVISFIDSIQGQFSETSSTDALVSFKATSEDIRDLALSIKKESDRRSRDNHKKEIQARLQRAQADDDQERIRRYTRLLQKINGS